MALALLAAPVTAASAEPDDVSSAVPVDATVITEVLPFGIRATGLAVKYDQIVNLGEADLDEGAFEVDAVLSRAGAEDLTGARTVVRAYTATGPEFSDEQVPGEYVILELDPNDGRANFSYSEGGFTEFFDVVGTHSVTQVADLDGSDGVLPATPEITVVNSAVSNVVIDEYSTAVFSADSGVTLPYRMFTPQVVSGVKYPLVVTLHGSGERGSDNFAQIASNQISTAFSSPSRQATMPAFVLSPQATRTVPNGEGGWTNATVQDALIDLIEEAISANPQIDTDRIYIAGLSMGARGSWQLLPNHTDLFAGAVLAAGGGDADVAAPALAGFPMWVAHSEDDPSNPHSTSYQIFERMAEAGIPVVFSQWSGIASKADQEAAARDAIARAEALEARHLYTTYPTGTTPVYAHLSWVPTFGNDAILDWLFAQQKDVAHATAKAIDATVITEVLPLGLRATGVVVEYDQVVDAGDIDPSVYDVDAVLSRDGAEDLVGSRTVVEAYTNADPAFTSTPVPGRFVILELDSNDPLANVTWSNGSFTAYYDLVGSVSVAQVGDLVGGSGTVPAQPENVVTNSGVTNLVIDEYDSGVLEAESGVVLPYRSFTPALEAGEKYPLVLTLHGHGESGTDNFAQIAGNQISTAFSAPGRQAENPAFVISPQAAQSEPLGPTGWWAEDVQAAVIELVELTIAENPQIDTDRIYLTGLSMGAFGSWGLLRNHTDLFAGAILVCGHGDEEALLPVLGDFPVWVVHSEDDFVVAYDAPGSGKRILEGLEAAGHPVVWSEWAGTAPAAEQFANAQAARAQAEAVGAKHLMTTYPAGTTPIFSHLSWVPTYENDAIVGWLFDQRQADDPTDPGTGEPTDPGTGEPTESEGRTPDTGANVLPIAFSALFLVMLGGLAVSIAKRRAMMP